MAAGSSSKRRAWGGRGISRLFCFLLFPLLFCEMDILPWTWSFEAYFGHWSAFNRKSWEPITLRKGFLPHTINKCSFLSFHFKRVHTMTMGFMFQFSIYTMVPLKTLCDATGNRDISLSHFSLRVARPKWSSRSGFSWRPGDLSSESNCMTQS